MKKLTLFIIFIFSALIASAQDYAKLTSAFSDSYAKEKAGKYLDAVMSLKACYSTR